MMASVQSRTHIPASTEKIVCQIFPLIMPQRNSMRGKRHRRHKPVREPHGNEWLLFKSRSCTAPMCFNGACAEEFPAGLGSQHVFAFLF